MIGQFLVNGIITGVLYSLLAIGFALVYNTTKIFHIAAAAIYVFAAFMFYLFAVPLGLPILVAALMAILQGCSDIADEVGSSKIYAAWHGEDVTYIESPHSYMSITDFRNNIISIQNAYMGGIEGQRDEGKSLHSYLKSLNAGLDSQVLAAIDNALAKIDAMPAPFALHYSEAVNGEAVEACAALSDALGEAIDAIRNN